MKIVDPAEWRSFDRIYQKLRINEIIKNIKGESVLEIGGRYGYISAKIARDLKLSEVYSLDNDEEPVEEGKKLYPYVNFIIEDVYDFKPKRKYDTVILPEVVEHLEFPDEILKKVVGLANKRIIITVPNRNRVDNKYHYQIFTKERLEAMIKRNVKFKDLRIIPVARDSVLQRNSFLKKVVGRVFYYFHLDSLVKLNADFENSCFLVAVIDIK
ncbi:MAG: methyltransferase domain-containing protein [Candidatus Nanoarchaeia archaeon]|nr:methyltransferase domain-containing protein [Candidatus Nanoarchaeia archaeon]